jgi:hypothetical protein
VNTVMNTIMSTVMSMTRSLTIETIRVGDIALNSLCGEVSVCVVWAPRSDDIALKCGEVSVCVVWRCSVEM